MEYNHELCSFVNVNIAFLQGLLHQISTGSGETTDNLGRPQSTPTITPNMALAFLVGLLMLVWALSSRKKRTTQEDNIGKPMPGLGGGPGSSGSSSSRRDDRGDGGVH